MKTINLRDYNDESENQIPIQVDSVIELTELVEYWMKGKPDNHIFVMFDAWASIEGPIRKRFIVSQFQSDVKNYLTGCVHIMHAYPLHRVEFGIFEFAIWEDAFYFCADLQEELG